MKHTELEFEYSLEELDLFLKESYPEKCAKKKNLSKLVFDDIHYMHELLYLESSYLDNAEERYLNIIQKVVKKHVS